MARTAIAELRRAVEQLPSGVFVMTAAFESKRSGVAVTSVQRCADEPLLICVASRKGHAIEPLIRDSHRFAVCRLDPDDKITLRRFDRARAAEDRYDPFDSLEVCTLCSHAPILKRSDLVMECEVFRHFDLEADHELYVGCVIGARGWPEYALVRHHAQLARDLFIETESTAAAL